MKYRAKKVTLPQAMGFVMRRLNGKINPRRVHELIKEVCGA